MSYSRPAYLLVLLAYCLQLGLPVFAHPPPPQANDVFGTVNGCASALVEMDTNQDGMVKKEEYFNFVNLLADFLCVPPRPVLDLEIQTVFFSIACLCQEREGFDSECCFGTDAAIWTQGAADAVTRTEDQDAYLRAACLLTQSILGPQQCTIAPATLAPEAIVAIGRLAPISSGSGLSDEALWAIIIGAILLALLCCLLLCCVCKKKDKDEDEEEEEVIIKLEDLEEGERDGEVMVGDVKEIEPMELKSTAPVEEPPIQESRSIPAPPIAVPLPVKSAPAKEEEDSEEEEEDSEDIGRKMGASTDDESEDENTRRFGGMGMLPGRPEPERVVLRHIEVQKEAPGGYEYPERDFIEHNNIPDEDSVQEFDPYIPDGGVYDPQRAPKAPVVFATPKYERKQKPKPPPYDERKFRQQLAMGDGEVWESLAAHEETRAQTKENKFEWIVQGALEVLAKAQESGELTKPKPKRAMSPDQMRTSASPPPRARFYGATSKTPAT